MEVATGEHGEWVHKLVLAVNKGKCGRGQICAASTANGQQSSKNNYNANTKTNNTDKLETLEVVSGKLSYVLLFLLPLTIMVNREMQFCFIIFLLERCQLKKI